VLLKGLTGYTGQFKSNSETDSTATTATDQAQLRTLDEKIYTTRCKQDVFGSLLTSRSETFVTYRIVQNIKKRSGNGH